MTPEEIWRSKTDEEVIAAMERLDEFTEIGQRIIAEEFARRELNFKEAISASVLNDVGVIEPVAAGPAFTSRNPIVRLWRGEFSLPATYWLWGLLGNLVFWIVFELVKRANNIVILLPLIPLGLAYYVMCVVAIWRSSGRYTGNGIWRVLARLMIIMGIIRLLTTL